MSTLLVLHSSLNSASSVTRELTAAFVQRFLAHHPVTTLIERDLITNPIPHLTPDMVPSVLGQEAGPNLADTLIDELERADVVVIGAPMYNFTVSSALKAWIDHVYRAKRTFAYVDGVPTALLPPGKKVILFVSSGGAYTEGAAKSIDFVEPFMRTAFKFIGISDVTIIRAESQASPEAASAERSRAMQRAMALSI
ncbi:FMN-dependent NADH-azoreductase [Variovorax atrisoli]|uniref:FMN-dependent NADH-azoreductase n=1 Tax=Variovorax atrisoli TaxID=3394203 RepID=UPI003397537D